MAPPIQLLHTNENSSRSNLRKKVFTPRLTLATLLLPSIYLVTPSILLLILRTISSLSSGHEYLSIFLSILLTNTALYQIYVHAPTEKDRVNAYQKCTWKLPLACLVFSMLICRMIGSSSMDETSWWNTDKWWGVRLFILGVSLSLITSTRFIGPFKIGEYHCIASIYILTSFYI